MIRMIIPTTLLILATTASGEIYRCTDDKGKLTYSDSKCSVDAETVEMELRLSGLQMGAQGDWSGVISVNKARDKDRAIVNHHQTVQQLITARNKRLASLRSRKNRTANNLAGATLDQAISSEMQAVSADYNARIQLERDTIQELRSSD